MIKLSPRPPDKSAYLKKKIFLIRNICCGCSKEPSQWDGSFEHPKHIFNLMGKEVNVILSAQTILIWTYALTFNDCVLRNLLSILVPWGNFNTILMASGWLPGGSSGICVRKNSFLSSLSYSPTNKNIQLDIS